MFYSITNSVVKTVKTVIAVTAVSVMLTGCNNGVGTDKTVTYQDIFPLESTTNWWHYSDANGNKLTVTVVDTITDDGDKLFKTQLYEEVVNSTTNYWFLLNSNEVMYSNSLRDDYTKLLPKNFDDDEGDFWVNGDKVEYELHNNYATSKAYYRDVVELNYDRVTLDGFSTIVFADDIGPVRFIDNSGRYTITYDLDSAFVKGNYVFAE